MSRMIFASALMIATLMPTVAPAQSDDQGAGPLLVDAASAAKLGYRLQWQTNLALPGDAKFHYVQPLDDLIITVESGNIVAAVLKDSGQIIWRRQHAEALEELTEPQRVGDVVVVCSERNAYLMRYDNGDLLRKRRLNHVAGTRPVLDGNYAIFGSPSGLVFCEDLESTVTRWTYRMHGAALTDPIRINRAVIVADGSGRVAAFNTITGALLWMQAAPPWGPIRAQPAAGEGYAFVASQDQALYGFEHTTGQFWRYLTQSKLTGSPVTIDEMVFLVVDGQLMCFDVYTGQLIWTQDQVVGKPLLRSGKQLLVVRDQRIDVLNVDDGAMLGSVDLPHADCILTDQAIDGSLLIVNNDGRVARLTASR